MTKNITKNTQGTETSILLNPSDIKHSFSSARGVVVGKMYGGGLGCYAARNFTADSIEELKAKIQKAFDLGSLDSGFGFEKLLAAGVVIEDKASVNIVDQQFTSSTFSNYIIGDVDLFQEQLDCGVILED